MARRPEPGGVALLNPPSPITSVDDPTKMLLVGCWQEGTVAPGGPYSISWEVWSINLTPDLGDVYGQVYLNNKLIYTTKTVPFVNGKNGGDSGLQFETEIAGPQDQALRAALYKLGPKTLELRIVASGADAKKWQLSTEFDLDVEPIIAMTDNPPANAQGTWDILGDWDLANLPRHRIAIGVEYGTPYEVEALFCNTGMVGLKGAFHLHEVCKDPQQDRISDTEHFPADGDFLGANLCTLALWKPIKQGWTWFAPVGYFPLEARGKKHEFVYSVFFTMQDELGNSYPADELGSFVVTITISDHKYLLASEAAVAFAAGTGLLVISAFTPWPANAVIAALGTAAVAVAIGLAVAAADPPVPNTRYLEKVVIAPNPVSKALTANARLTPFGDFVAVMNRILAADAALSEIESRLLGARQANDREGIALQKQSYREAIDYVVSAAGELQAATAGVATIKEIKPLFDVRTTRRRLQEVRRRGVTPAMRKAWAKAGVPKKTAAQVAAALRDHTVLALAERGFAPTLAMIPSIMTRYAKARQQEAVRIFDLPEPTGPLPAGTIVTSWRPKPIPAGAKSRRGRSSPGGAPGRLRARRP